MSEPTISTTPPTEPPPPPRPITSAARRQSWREVAVRKWMLGTLAIGAVVAAVGSRSTRTALDERALLRDGVPVEARLEELIGAGREADRSIARDSRISFTLPGESEPRTVRGDTRPQPGRLTVGQSLPVVVNPKDPGLWTDRMEPPGWAKTLAAPLLLTPIVALLAALTWFRRRRILNVWRDGQAARGSVLDVQTSALVPGQKVVRVAVPGEASSRTVRVTHPDRFGARARGDAIDVIVSPRGDAVLAAAYE